MAYFSYHAAVKRLIREGKLTGWYFTERHNRIAPALVLEFDDPLRPRMPLRAERWAEYESLLPVQKRLPNVGSPFEFRDCEEKNRA